MQKTKQTALALIGIIGLFFFTRIQAIRIAGSYWFDEAFSVYFASMSFDRAWQYLQFEHNPLLPITVLRQWINIFGASEIATRSLSMVFGFASILLIFYLGQRLFSKRIGLLAAFVMTLSPMMLYHQTETRMYSMVIAFALLVLLSCWQWLQTKNTWWLVLYAVSAIALVQTHLTTWILLAALFIYYLIEEKTHWLKWVLVHLLILISFLFWFVPVIKNRLSIGGTETGWFFFQHEASYWFLHLVNYFLNGEQGLWIRSLGGLILLTLLVLAFVQFEKPSWWQKIHSFFQHDSWPLRASLKWDQPRRFLFFTLVIPLLIGFALQVTITKYLVVASIPFFILIAVGLDALPKSARIFMVTILCILVLPMQLRLLTEPRHYWQQAAQDIQQELDVEGTKAISHSFAWALPLRFYGIGDDEVELVYPFDDGLSFEGRVVRYNWQPIINRDNVQVLNDLTNETNRLILVSSTPGRGYEDPVKAWFAENGWKLVKTYMYPGYGDPELVIYER